MMELPAIRAALGRAGFQKEHETTKVEQFKRGTLVVYLKKPISGRTAISHPLVVHGDNSGKVGALCAIVDVIRAKPSSAYYHNANMTAFERRTNTGKGKTHYGLDFDVKSEAGLLKLVDSIV